MSTMKGPIISSETVGTATSSTLCPRPSSALAVARAAELQASSVGIASGAAAISPIRSDPGCSLICCANVSAAGGALYQARLSGAASTSSTAAESATVRVRTPSTTAPSQLWARRGMRPRLVFRPTSPQ